MKGTSDREDSSAAGASTEPKPSPADDLTAAIAEFKAGRAAAAKAICLQILEGGENPDALHLLGLVALRETDMPAAADYFARAVAAKPDAAAFRLNLGSALHALGRRDDAIASFHEVLAIDPGFAAGHLALGHALGEQGALTEAASHLQKAVALDPRSAPAWFRLGNILLRQRYAADAAECYRRAVALDPSHAPAHGNLGVALRQQGKVEEAMACYRRAAAIRPDFADAHYNLGVLLQSLGRYGDALQSLESALRLRPDNGPALAARANVKAQICTWDGWAEDARKLRDLAAAGFPVNPFQFLSVCDDPGEQLRCARRYAKQLVPVAPPPLWQGQARAGGKIRLAYLSSDFHDHPTAHLIAELLETHDRNRFEVFAFSYGPESTDPMRERLRRGVDHFFDVRELGDAEVARRIFDAEIGIVVNLSGYSTTQRIGAETRAAVLAHRPAPVQAGYLGYPGTMGADYMDYILVDSTVAPAADQPFYTERLVHLPDSYQVNDRKRAIAAETPARSACGLPESGFVFCCFNAAYKITPFVFDIWMRVLAKTPGSVLWLLDGGDAAKANLRREAESRAIAAERIVFAPRLDLARHLARHRLAGLFLDTQPVNAITTASDALWAGLPVLTVPGRAFPGRAAASLLKAANLPELIAPDWESYESLAAGLASSPDRLGQIRAKLESGRATAPLFDLDRFRRHIEAAYSRMWETHLNGDAPAPFAVAAETA